MRRVACIGTGIMGGHMAAHLLHAGYTLQVHNRTKAKAAPLVESGALWCKTPGLCAQNADFVLTIVGYPQDVEAIYLGEDGIIANARPGAILIDMTTSSPALAQRIYEAAKQKGLQAVDAPVSGGDAGAKQAALVIMAGGDESAVSACMPLFACMGKRTVHIGGAGAGQHCKMANQIALAGAIAGVSEALAYVRSMGVEEEAVFDCIGGGAAGSWQMQHNGPLMRQGHLDPGFYIKHYCKDMRIAKDEAADRQLALPVLDTVYAMYQTLLEKGHQDLGTQAIIKYFEQT